MAVVIPLNDDVMLFPLANDPNEVEHVFLKKGVPVMFPSTTYHAGAAMEDFAGLEEGPPRIRIFMYWDIQNGVVDSTGSVLMAVP